jgi:hypothetical protein
MALTGYESSWKITNTTDSGTKTLQLRDMKEVENYNRKPISNGYRYSNSTVGFNGDEVFDLTSEPFTNMGKCPVRTDSMSSNEFVSYGINNTYLKVTEDTSDTAAKKYFDPLMIQIRFRQPKTDFISAEDVWEALEMTASKLKDEANSLKRLSALQKGALAISQD